MTNASWFLQMRIHQYEDFSTSIDQLQCEIWASCHARPITTFGCESLSTRVESSRVNLALDLRGACLYVLIHVDNLMVASRRAKSIIEGISKVYTLKEDKETKLCYGPPDVYLGSKIHKYHDPDADPDAPYCWSIVTSSEKQNNDRDHPIVTHK